MAEDIVLVTGGTGNLGSHIVPRLRTASRAVRVLSRHRPDDAKALAGVEYVAADLNTGEGVEAALAGVATIVHCAGGQKGDEDRAARLVRTASRVGGVRHLVNISVVGADRVPVVSGVDRAMFSYFSAKLAAERVVAESGIPWTILRATQFHELILLVARALAKLPVAPLPAGMRFQPIEVDEVAARMVELALGAPSGLAPDIAGPKVYSTKELFSAYLRANRQRKLTIPLWLPGKAARAIRAGANLNLERAVGRRTWEEFLAAQVSASHGGQAAAPSQQSQPTPFSVR